MPSGHVDDAQTAVGEHGMRVSVHAGTVGSTVREDVAHAQHARCVVSL
jgi:hypothetical protein